MLQNKLISEKLFTHPSVNISPSANSRFITVGGGVRAPGRQPWSADLTVMSAINVCGGLSDFGSLRNLRLIRDGKATVYDGRNFEKDPSQDPKLLPGDQIVVRQ